MSYPKSYITDDQDEDLDDTDRVAKRYHRQPVIPILACDPVAVLLKLWLALPRAVTRGIVAQTVTHTVSLTVAQNCLKQWLNFQAVALILIIPM